jgi:hypothetical protein
MSIPESCSGARACYLSTCLLSDFVIFWWNCVCLFFQNVFVYFLKDSSGPLVVKRSSEEQCMLLHGDKFGTLNRPEWSFESVQFEAVLSSW